MNGRTTGILGLLLVGLFATQNWAAESTADVANETTVKKVRSVEGITEFELENGLRVLLLPDPSRPTVTVNLTILVGSRHEGYGEAGMAHLLEHMVFKGTPLHPNVPKALQDRGAQFNGTTSIDRTNYYETLPASDDNLEFAIRLEADRMINSFVKGEDLASEMMLLETSLSEARISLCQCCENAWPPWPSNGTITASPRLEIAATLNEFRYRNFAVSTVVTTSPTTQF